jgi:putative ABC transport system permease protein
MLFDVLIVGYVRANARRALATVFALALGVGVAVAAVLAERTVSSALARDVGALDDGVALRVVGNGSAFRETALANVEDIEGVARAIPAIDGALVLGASRARADAGETVHVIGVDLLQPLPGVASSGIIDPGPFTPSGSFAPELAIDGGGIVVPSPLAARLGLHVGTRVSALDGTRFVELPVAAILAPSAVGADRDTVFVDLATAQSLFDDVGRLDRIDVVCRRIPCDDVRARVAAALPHDARVEDALSSGGGLPGLGGALGFDFVLLGALALAAGGLLAADATAASVAARRSEIGTLRALGVTRGAIFRTFVAEGAFYGTVGALAGLELGALGARYLLGAFVPGSDLAVGSLAVVYDPVSIAAVSLGAVVIAALASAVPARAAMAIPPAFATASSGVEVRPSRRAARATTALATIATAVALVAGILGRSALCAGALVLATIGFVPAIARRAAALSSVFALDRRIARSPGAGLALLAVRGSARRASVAAAALGLALAASIALAVTAHSLRGAVAAWAAQNYRGDLDVRPLAAGRGGISAAALARATSVPGVTRVQFERSATLAFADGTVRVRGEGSDPQQLLAATRSAAAPVRPQVELTPAPAVLSARFAARYRVPVGATISLATPSGALTVRATTIRPDYGERRATLTLDARTFARAFAGGAVDSFSIVIAHGVSLESVRKRVFAALAPQRVDVRSTREERTRALALFDGTVELAYGVGALVTLIALAGVANALTGLVFERRRELAMLRFVGATRGVVRTTMLGQAAFVGGLGCAVGLALGLGLAFVQFTVVDSASLDQPLAPDVPLGTVLGATLVTFVAALVAAIRPAQLAAAIPVDRAREDRA